MNVKKIARRTFLLGTAAIAGGVAIGYWYVNQPYANPLEDDLAEGDATFNPYVKISADNTLTVIVPRAEMGQGVQTTLAAMVAEELGVGLDEIEVEHGPGDFAYYNAAMLEEGGPFPFFDESFLASAARSAMYSVSKTLGLQVTGGSSSTRDAYDKMRQAGAATREILKQAGAERFKVSAEECAIEGRNVVHAASGQRAQFADLATDASKLKAPSEITLKNKSDWQLLGKPQPRVDLPAKVTGQAVFGIDVDLPNMIYGTVVMSPRFGAKSVSADIEAARAVSGVLDVIEISAATGSGYGILAEHTWAAFKGAEALSPKWEEAAYPKNNAEQMEALKSALQGPPVHALRDEGSVDTAFADAPAEQVIEAQYTVPWLAHATLEPMNATARWKDGVLDIWAPTQAPSVLKMVCGPLVGVESEEVRVHATYLGGGFGRRGEVDFAIYAVEMAKAAAGRPVKVTWTREEDTRHDTYRPMATCKLKARFTPGESIDALDMTVAAPSIMKSVIDRTFPGVSLAGPDKTLMEGAFDQPYAIPNFRVGGSPVDLGVPVGFWRAVGNSCNAWFLEAFIDEVATASNVDPLALRLKLAKDFPAATGALEQVARMSGWGRDMPKGKGLGIAHTLSFGAWVAMVAQVSVEDNELRVDHVWAVAEMGEVLDPAIVKAQIMSGIVFGLSAAMLQKITFEDGQVAEGNFDEFEILQMDRCPKIDVELRETYHKMGGAGEPGLPPVLPALTNAIYVATGKRIRSAPTGTTLA